MRIGRWVELGGSLFDMLSGQLPQGHQCSMLDAVAHIRPSLPTGSRDLDIPCTSPGVNDAYNDNLDA